MPPKKKKTNRKKIRKYRRTGTGSMWKDIRKRMKFNAGVDLRSVRADFGSAIPQPFKLVTDNRNKKVSFLNEKSLNPQNFLKLYMDEMTLREAATPEILNDLIRRRRAPIRNMGDAVRQAEVERQAEVARRAEEAARRRYFSLPEYMIEAAAAA